MKNLPEKNFKKKTIKLYSFNNYLSGGNPTDTIIGDPTNTTITVLTTVSGQIQLSKPGKIQGIS